MLESYISALDSTRGIIKVEQQRIQKEISEVADSLARRAAAEAAAAAVVRSPSASSAGGPAPPGGSFARAPSGGSVAAAAAAAPAGSTTEGEGDLVARESVDLATQLAELHGKLSALDADLEAIKPLLAANGARAEERDIHETKLVVLQVGCVYRLVQLVGRWMGSCLHPRQWSHLTHTHLNLIVTHLSSPHPIGHQAPAARGGCPPPRRAAAPRRGRAADGRVGARRGARVGVGPGAAAGAAGGDGGQDRPREAGGFRLVVVRGALGCVGRLGF
jgi:hypothetical protein